MLDPIALCLQLTSRKAAGMTSAAACRVLAAPAVPGDLKRGISTAMLRLLAHSSGLIDTHPGSHVAHSPGRDQAESVTPRAAHGEWPISPPLRAAIAKIALGHQRPLSPASPNPQASPSGASHEGSKEHAGSKAAMPNLSGASTSGAQPASLPGQQNGFESHHLGHEGSGSGSGSGIAPNGRPGGLAAALANGGGSVLLDGSDNQGLPLLPIDADGLLQRLCGLLERLCNQGNLRDGQEDGLQGVDAGQVLALSLLAVGSCMSASVGLARCLRAQDCAFR